MKLFKTTDNGILKFENLTAVASNTLADKLGLQHSNVKTAIKRVMKYEKIRQSEPFPKRLRINHIAEENNPNFNAVFKDWEYTSRGKTFKTYIMNEDALYLVIANLKGQKAHEMKVWFKSEFNKMRDEITARKAAIDPTKRLNDSLDIIGKELKEKLPDSKKSGLIYVHVQSAINGVIFGKNKGINRDTITEREALRLVFLEGCIADKVEDMLLDDDAEPVRAYILDTLKDAKSHIKKQYKQKKMAKKHTAEYPEPLIVLKKIELEVL